MDDVVGKIQFLIEVDQSTGITNVKKFDKTVKDSTATVQEAEKKQTKAFDGINLKAVALASAVGVAFMKVAKNVIDATGNIENGQKTIVNATGATGDNLQSLMNVAKEVYAEADDSFESVSVALGEINTRLGYTGEQLKDTTSLFLDFADVTGQDVQQAVAGTVQAMNQWNLSAEELPLLLDQLTVAGQVSGVSVSALTTNLTQNAGTLQAMGYSLEESISMMMSFEKQGIDSASVIMAMKQSFSESAKAGTDARQDWENLLESIANATSETEANEMAVSVFGNRIASTMVTALRNGKVSMDEFSDALKNAEGTMRATDEAGKSTADRIEVLKHNFELALADIGQQLAPMIEQLLPTVLQLIQGVITALEPMVPILGDIVSSLLPPLLPLLESLGKLITELLVAVSPLLKALAEGIASVLTPLIPVLESIAKKMSILIAPIEKLVRWITGAKDETKEFTAETKEETKAIEEQSSATEKASKAVQKYVKATDSESLSVGNATTSMTGYKTSVEQTAVVTEDMTTKTTDLKDALTETKVEAGEAGSMFQTMQALATSAFQTMGSGMEALGKSLASGSISWKELGKSAMKAVAGIVRALGHEMTARAVLAMFSFRWAEAGMLLAGATTAYLSAGLIEGWADSLLVGKDYVPYDGYPATLHRGEMVLTRQESERFRSLGGLYGMEKQASLPFGFGLGAVNVNSNLSAVIEVDGTQLGVAVLKNIDNASQFVLR